MESISIYIHWPFCMSLCPYCDFNSHLSTTIDQEIWIRSYKMEIDYFAPKIRGKFIKSVFFGGGTPSLMPPKIVDNIIQHLSNLGKISTDTEITLEANPTSYEEKKFKSFKMAGINRVSIGVQSFQEANLKLLGRKHSTKDAIQAIESASNIFDRYSFDLIYAIPSQTLKEWKSELEFALSLSNGHISLYQLTIEKGTEFYRLFHDGKLRLPSNDLAANMYELTNNYLQNADYNSYEISNYAMIGQESIHNLCYWNYNEYIGIGPGAHSRLHETNNIISAIMMIHKPERWLQSVSENKHGIQTQKHLKKYEIIEEILMMGTRIKTGVSEEKLLNITEKSFKDILNFKAVEYYQKQGLLQIQNAHLMLTSKGLLLHNYIIPRILEATMYSELS